MGLTKGIQWQTKAVSVILSWQTKIKTLDLQVAELMKNLEVASQRMVNQLDEEQKRSELEAARQQTENANHDAQLGRQRARADQDLAIEARRQKLAVERMTAEAEAVVKKFQSFQGDWSEAMLALSNNETMQKIAQATAPLSILGGPDIASVVSKMFDGTPLKGVFENMKRGNGTGAVARLEAIGSDR
jgi:major vault protein